MPYELERLSDGEPALSRESSTQRLTVDASAIADDAGNSEGMAGLREQRTGWVDDQYRRRTAVRPRPGG